MVFVFFKILKTRALEFLLITVVVAALIAAMAAQASLSGYSEDRVHDFAHNIGGNMLIVSDRTDLGKFFEMRADYAGMPASYAGKLFDSPVASHIRVVYPRIYGKGKVNGTTMSIIGGGMVQSNGNGLDLPDDHALVGQAAAKQMGVRQGDAITVTGAGKTGTFMVDRVLDRAPEGIDTGIFINLDMARRILGRPDDISSMRIAGCWCSLDIDKLAADVEKNLPGTRALTVKGMIKAQKSMIETVKSYSLLVNIVGCLFISLIVGLSIYSLTRRQLIDIALFLIVGARPWMIVMIFVTMAALIGLAGGALGWALCPILIKKIGVVLIGASLPVSGIDIKTVLGFATMLSAGAALIPALVASRRNPSDIFAKE
ncbi:MAG: hypothetical protein GXP53_06625 [Deltaproteobacteria bacterium]|nr:hypothetical protein [Deltaproteobacteria bacterium]